MGFEDEDRLLATDELVAKMLAGVCAVKVGRIEAFDPKEWRVSVKPLIRRFGEHDGEQVEKSQPQIDNVPVFVLGDDDFDITLPVKVGSRCILLFSDEPLEKWLDSGEEAPASREKGHDISDCCAALVGIKPFKRAAAAPQPPTDGVAIRARGGISAVFRKQSIELGGADEKVVKETPTKTWMQQVKASIASLTAPTGGGPVTASVPFPDPPGDLGSSKVKVGA